MLKCNNSNETEIEWKKKISLVWASGEQIDVLLRIIIVIKFISFILLPLRATKMII